MGETGGNGAQPVWRGRRLQGRTTWRWLTALLCARNGGKEERGKEGEARSFGLRWKKHRKKGEKKGVGALLGFGC